jgi:CheY-like chemotaxis protein/class 3 adenylate cyclase
VTDVPVVRSLLFTDVEHSTEVVDRHGTAGVQALVDHHEIVRSVVAGEGGDLFERIGDAAYAALEDPAAALRAAVEIHRRLAAEDFGGIGPLRVRIAVDTGRVERRDGRYLGRPLYRCARIQALARGGETLLSDEAAVAVGDRLPPGHRLRDLGGQKLKGLAQRVRIWGLVVAAAGEARIRVLLVDDHEVVRRGLRGFLELLPDMEIVGEAADGAAGLELANRLAPDVVLMDLVMPTMDGPTAIDRLRSTQPEVAVVALTSFTEPDRIAAALGAGAAGHLLKDAEADEVAAAVRAAAGRS